MVNDRIHLLERVLMLLMAVPFALFMSVAFFLGVLISAATGSRAAGRWVMERFIP